MNLATYYYQLKANHKFLNNQALLVLDNLEKYIRSTINTYGIVVKKLTNGELDVDLLPNNKGNVIDLNGGYVIYDDNGELRIVKVETTPVSLTNLS